jgi:hypothetical protein
LDFSMVAELAYPILYFYDIQFQFLKFPKKGTLGYCGL